MEPENLSTKLKLRYLTFQKSFELNVSVQKNLRIKPNLSKNRLKQRKAEILKTKNRIILKITVRMKPILYFPSE